MKNKQLQCGVYAVTNRTTGQRYVGQSIDLTRRWKNHLMLLRKGMHHCRHLQNSFIKHGEKAFDFCTLVLCQADELVVKEQHWIDFYRATGVYNLAPAAGSNAGITWSSESKAKASRAKAGIPLTKEHKEKIRLTLIGNHRTRGHKLSAEHIAKIVSKTTGQKRAVAQINRTSFYTKGHSTPDAVRAKISAAQIGGYRKEETKRKISVYQRANSEITAMKMRAKWADPEYREAMLAARKVENQASV